MNQISYIQPQLFPSGIQTEQSDIRCHVAPGTRLIFVFQTAAIIGLDLTKYSERPAYQPGVDYATAKGYLVPPDEIPGMRTIRWKTERWWECFDKKDTTSAKGRKAVAVVERLLRSGRFPLWPIEARESTRLEVQRGGTDIVLWGRWRIQIKCDYDAGRGDVNQGAGKGTGYLFLQTAELNPLRLH